MRKFFLNILIICGVLASLLLSTNVTSAQFSWTNFDSGNPAQIDICDDCSIDTGLEEAKKLTANNINTEKPLSELIQDIIIYALGFVTIIAVIYVIYAGFKIMIGSGDEGSLKESKKTILYVMIGIVIMWLAYSIVNFVITNILKANNQTSQIEIQHEKNFFALNFFPKTHAQNAFTESYVGTFEDYKARLQSAANDMEADWWIYKKVNPAHVQKTKNLLNEAFNRLPDQNPAIAGKNAANKKAAEAKLEKLAQNLDSQTALSEAGSALSLFVTNSNIQKIQGSIAATPDSGNSPLVVSFSAQNVVDPSGATPPARNYYWWIKEGRGRKILGTGANLHRVFTNPGTYTVFLDVISSSKNSHNYTDVLPLSQSISINVAPSSGELVLLLNGVNVSNRDQIKIPPILAARGVLFDAAASRAQNGEIVKTEWNFGNGNTRTYNGPPRQAEQQVFSTNGIFDVELRLTTNKGEVFSKKLQLVVKDPIATIKADKDFAFTNESISFSAENILGDTRNVEYLWLIQHYKNSNDVTKLSGRSITHTFKNTGIYSVTLRTKHPNGSDDTDTKHIDIQARNPIVGFDNPKIISTEQPDTFIFDASKSYDPDTNSKKDLSYRWEVNGKKIHLNNSTNNQASGTYTFDTTGEKEVKVTVINAAGKTEDKTQTIRVDSILAGDVKISPEVAPIGKEISLTALSRNAKFFEWNFGDGTPIVSGDFKAVKHRYEKTGTYNLTLRLLGNEGELHTTTIQRKIFITDANSPFAHIDVSNISSSAIFEPNACNGNGAYILKRGESTTLNASKSINVDGSNSNLSYTWKYLGKTSTNQSIVETFRELGCFPVELTVRSGTTGATHKTVQYIYLKNQAPELTSITTTIDSNKRDSQKVIVKATANGAKDPDGVITSYIWYYTTESDKDELQGVQISQKPEMTFVLPNIAEKYYFGAIIEDNDGARVNSKDILQGEVPTIIGDGTSNIYMPLISLTAPNKTLKVGEKAIFKVKATTIGKTPITDKAKYSWDFDGDGKFDKTGSESEATWEYTKAGNYNFKVRVTNNGVSNTKYHTVIVRNELNAQTQAYKIVDEKGAKLYLMNTSQGVYEKALWKIGNFTSENPDSVIIDLNEALSGVDNEGNIGTLTITNGGEFKTTPISVKNFKTIISNNNNEITYQSFPVAENDTITIKDPSESLKISLFGNKASAFAIDTNANMDSSSAIEGDNGFDGIADNDIDNLGTASYSDGSLFTIKNFSNATSRKNPIKITLYQGNIPVATKTISVILDFIPENPVDSENANILDSVKLSDFYKTKLNELATAIRALPEGDRIVTMKYYNSVVENWGSDLEKTKSLIDIQDYLSHSQVSKAQQEEIVTIIDDLLVGESEIRNDINVSVAVLKYLISKEKYPDLYNKIEEISGHPNDVETNRKLGQEILDAIKDDPYFSDEIKSIIKMQLVAIRDSGYANSKGFDTLEPLKKSSGIGGTLLSILKIIGIILLCVIVIGIILFIVYRRKRDNEEIGLQDYIIDNVFHGKKSEEKNDPITVNIVQKEEKKPEPAVDPLKTFTPPEEKKSDPLATESTETQQNNAEMPDWLKPQAEQESSSTSTPSQTDIAQGGLPDWLKPQENTQENTLNTEKSEIFSQKTEEKSEEAIEEKINTIPSNDTELPDWLTSSSSKETSSLPPHEEGSEDVNTELPDWLKPQTEAIPQNEEKISETPIETITPEPSSELPDWLRNASSEIENSLSNDNKDDSHDININKDEDIEATDLVTDNPDEIGDINEKTTPEKEFIKQDNNFSYTKSKKNSEAISAPSEENELPNWLVNDNSQPHLVETTESIPEESETPTSTTSKPSNTKKTTKPRKKPTNKQVASDSESPLPDWLK